MERVSGLFLMLAGVFFIGTTFVDETFLPWLWHMTVFTFLLAIYLRVDAIK